PTYTLSLHDALPISADHHGQLDLVVVPAVEVNELHAFARADQRAWRLQEHACLVDLAHQVAVVDPLVGERLLEVLLEVHRRGDEDRKSTRLNSSHLG